MKNKKIAVGVRFDDEKDIERAWQKFEFKAREKFGSQLDTFVLYGLSKRSNEVKEYLASYINDDFKLEIPDVDINYVPPPRGKTMKELHAESKPVKKADS